MEVLKIYHILNMMFRWSLSPWGSATGMRDREGLHVGSDRNVGSGFGKFGSAIEKKKLFQNFSKLIR